MSIEQIHDLLLDAVQKAPIGSVVTDHHGHADFAEKPSARATNIAGDCSATAATPDAHVAQMTQAESTPKPKRLRLTSLAVEPSVTRSSVHVPKAVWTSVTRPKILHSEVGIC